MEDPSSLATTFEERTRLTKKSKVFLYWPLPHCCCHSADIIRWNFTRENKTHEPRLFLLTFISNKIF